MLSTKEAIFRDRGCWDSVIEKSSLIHVKRVSFVEAASYVFKTACPHTIVLESADSASP